MTYSYRQRLLLAAVCLTCATLAGCDSDEPGSTGDTDGATSSGDTEGGKNDESQGNPTENPSTSGEDTDSGPGDTDADTDTDTPGETDDGGDVVSLFDCGVELSCEQVIWHIDPEPHSATECVANLMASQTPGAISVLETLGPDVFEDESISFVRGDGTVIRQLRHRECEECDESTLPWEADAPLVCNVRVDVDNYQGCLDGNYECLAAYSLVDCAPLDDASCENVVDGLDNDAPELTACGDTSCPFGTICVEQAASCECDPRTGEYDYVTAEPTCQNVPDDCVGLDDESAVGCIGALCDDGPHEFDHLEGGVLSCGQDAGDCFGEC